MRGGQYASCADSERERMDAVGAREDLENGWKELYDRTCAVEVGGGRAQPSSPCGVQPQGSGAEEGAAWPHLLWLGTTSLVLG
mmetsp:Transcript_27252/g.43390  ORF Transcript_27252/g.43390 Transcript_27252/m.43390 type:complete len:83 (+) Transcript_27252:427-675(+)